MLDGLKISFMYSKETIFDVTFTNKTISYASVGKMFYWSLSF
jgi:hypothetical protein